ncbi:MAG: hypothetical protein OHK0052_19120 [Anaerolineales bacterium]
MTADWIGAIVGFVFTLAVFSYLIGDNPLFRVAIHIFIGVTAGYIAALTLFNIILPQLIVPMLFGSWELRAFVTLPFLLGGFLLSKITPRLSKLGNISMAYLLGVGAASAIGGAVFGTLIPQAQIASNSLVGDSGSGLVGFVNGLLALIGALSTLIYFQFGAQARPGETPQRNNLVEWIGMVGQGFIAITLGVIFAGVFSAALVALIERTESIWNFIRDFILIQFS